MNPGLSHFLISIGRIALIAALATLASIIVRRSLRVSITRFMKLRDGAEQDVVSDSRSMQRAKALIELTNSITRFTTAAIAFLLILDQLGINLAPLLAGASVVGVAIGFGAQALVKDILAGVSILAEDQYGIGDVVDVGEAIGVVESISLKSTRVRAVDGTLWHVPNGEIRRVANKSQEWSRLILDVGIAYASNLESTFSELKSILQDFAHQEVNSKSILEAPEIWGVEKLGASSVDIRLAIKVKAGTQWELARRLRYVIKERFDQANIEIPFQQVDIWNRS